METIGLIGGILKYPREFPQKFPPENLFPREISSIGKPPGNFPHM